MPEHRVSGASWNRDTIAIDAAGLQLRAFGAPRNDGALASFRACRTFIVRQDWNCYIEAMTFRWTKTDTTPPHLIVLDDHARLPWRFFGRMTAAIQAGL
jgi:hypothetical protein